MSKTRHSKVLILGSGPAGYTAAIYAARANLSPTLVAGMQPGGQLSITTDVENYPGYEEAIQGPWLMDQMLKQSENVGTNIVYDMITEVNLKQKPFLCYGDSGDIYSCDVLIICTGAQAKWLGLSSEEHFRGFGVSACATCDGFFFKNKHVCVVGGGNTAVEEAIYLTNHAEKVYLVHRRDELRAEKILQDRLFNNEKIEVIWNHTLKEINGNDSPKEVTSISLENTIDKSTKQIDVEGVFIAIGHAPATDLFKNSLDMDETGYIITKSDSTETNIPGVYAAGDVKDKIYRQAVTAAGMGCMAALEAEKYIAEHEFKQTETKQAS